MFKLIKNGNIYDLNTAEYVNKDILLENKKIIQIDHNIENEYAEIIDATDKCVYPGFIDAHTHIGMWTDTKNGNDSNECVNPLTPTIRAIDSYNMLDKSIEEMIEEGFTTIMITPGSGNVMCGQAAILKLGGIDIEERIVDSYAAFKVALGENPKSVYRELKMSPNSRMGTGYIIEDTLTKARDYYEKRLNNEISIDLTMEPFIPVFNGKAPLKVHCHRADDICTAIRIIEKFELDYTLDHCTEGYLVKNVLEKFKPNVMLGPLYMFRSKIECQNSTVDNILELNKIGCNVSIISDHPFFNAKYMVKILALAVKKGLPRNEAIKMLTINPAKALKVDNRLGSIEVGKDADMSIYDGDPIEMNTKNYMTILNGEIVYKRG